MAPAGALILGKHDGLSGDAEIAARDPPVFEHRRRRFPRDRRRDDHAEAADGRRRGDAEQAARGVDECAAGKAVVHRRGGANDLRDRAMTAGRQRTADDRDDAGARRHGVAPGARDREREMADARSGRGRGNRRRVQIRDAQDRQVGRRIPAGELGSRRSGRRARAHADRFRGRARAPW